MPRVLSKCLDMSSTTHFGGEDATRNELVEALKWFDQTPKEQADADRGYSCKQAFDVVLEENQISLCLVLRYLLKFFTHNAAQAAQVKCRSYIGFFKEHHIPANILWLWLGLVYV